MPNQGPDRGLQWNEAMLAGDFARAWEVSDLVMRQRRGQSCTDRPYHLRWVWDGAPLQGRRVLVRCYHGLGDTLQFIRFVPQVAAIACSVIVEAQAELLPLLRSIPGIAALYPLGAELPQWDVAIESMELPHALRLRLADLPGPIPYLVPPRGCASRLRSCSPNGPGNRAGHVRVGLVWAAGDWRSERSLPPALLLPLSRLPIDLVGLQRGPACHQAEAAGLVGALRWAQGGDATIAETAALIGELDLVITVDTMVAHLAGALGRPVWTVLDAEADWRWMRRRDDTPWYPTMRLFRQLRPGLWEPVVEQLAAALALPAAAPERDPRSSR